MRNKLEQVIGGFPLYQWLSVLLLCLLLFVFKWDVLGLPYYWDEAWVYVPAIRTMEASGPCLAPGCIPVDLNTGHPMGFYFLESAWMRLTGTGIFSSRLFPMFLSCILLFLCWWCFGKLFNGKVGLLSALFLGLQPIFLAQSSFLLAEVLLSIFTVLSFYFFFSRNYLGFILAATGLLYTKEPGIVLIGALGLVFLWQTWQRKRLDKQFWLQLLAFVVPVTIGFLFFLAQYLRFGWFLFPRHSNWVDFTPEHVQYKFRLLMDFMFAEQGRISVIKLVTIALTLFLPGVRPGWKILSLAAWFWANHQYDAHHNIYPLLVHAITWVLLGILVLREKALNQDAWLLPIAGAALYCLCYYLFSAANFMSMRYLLCTFPVLAALIAALLFRFMEKRSFWGKAAGMAILAFSIIGVYRNKTDHVIPFDVSLTYENMVRAEWDMVKYCESRNLQDEPFHSTFLVRHALSNPYSGYLSGRRFESVSEDTAGFKYLIRASNEQNPQQDSLISRYNMKLQQRFQYGYCTTELFAMPD